MELKLVKIQYHQETNNSSAWYGLDFVIGHTLVRQHIVESEFVDTDWEMNGMYKFTPITPNK